MTTRNTHARKWRTVPSTAHKPGSGSARVDIVDDGAPFAPSFVAGDIMPDDAALMVAAPELLAALEDAQRMLETASRYMPKSIKNADRFSLLNVLANSVSPAIAKAKGVQS